MFEVSTTLVKSRYGDIRVFDKDTGAATQSLLTFGEWADNELTFLQQFITSGSTVIDVGAYIGTHTLAFSHFVGSSGRVLAFEPQPETFEMLQSNVNANNSPDPQPTPQNATRGMIRLENVAVSSQLGVVSIPLISTGQQGNLGGASLLPLPGYGTSPSSIRDDSSPTASVRSITIDSLRLEACALIKIDVEGMEDLVLQGAHHTFSQCSPLAYCECNSLAAGLKSMRVLLEAGYQVFAHVVNAFNPNNFFGVKDSLFLGDAREVALVGVPPKLQADFRTLAVRPIEMVLQISTADDLSLALLNKPQYQVEVLRQSQAAKTGGSEFLDRLTERKLELTRLQSENAALQLLRQQEVERLRQQAADTQAIQAAEIAELHSHLTARDESITKLLREAAQRQLALAELQRSLHHSQVELARLSIETAARDREIAEVYAKLRAADSTVSSLETVIREKDCDLKHQEAEIANLSSVIHTKDEALGDRDRTLLNVQNSKSWQVTRPLRWVIAQWRRMGS